MPRNKDLKRLVRARMEKTGEAYTAARAQILRSPTVAPSAHATPKNLAALAGMRDAVVNEKTGSTWERWVRSLDHEKAGTMPHREIVALIGRKYKIGSWWSQMVAVGYERIKGLRVRGQQRNGTFEMTKSKTFDVPVEALFDAWADAAKRRRWLDGTSVKIRTATAPKSMRLDWGGDDGGIVAVGFTPKGESKSAVALAHAKLPDRDSAARLKLYWTERLDALGALLARRHANA